MAAEGGRFDSLLMAVLLAAAGGNHPEDGRTVMRASCSALPEMMR